MGGWWWWCRWAFAPEYFYSALGIDLLHEAFILLFASFRLCLVALDPGDILGVVDVP
jgi:hypothetical protein